MTTVLSYVSSYFSIILSDNRINYGHNQEYGYADDFKKLINLPEMGFSSGAGLHEYLVKMKSKLAQSEIKNIKDIVNIFKNVTDECKIEYPYFVNDIDSSVIITSWFGEDENDSFFRIGILSNKHFENNIFLIDKGNINIAYPGDYLNDQTQVDYLQKKFNLNIGEQDLLTVLSCLFILFDHISSTSKQVSTTCDIGIHTFWVDGIYKFTSSGEIKDLIDDLNQGKIFERFQEISSIKIKK